MDALISTASRRSARRKKGEIYRRAVVVKLYPTAKKRRKLKALIQAYRKAVNQYLREFDRVEPKLNKATLALVQTTKLSERYKSNALKQAIGIYKACVRTAKKVPKFRGFPVLDAKFVNLQDGIKSFDLVLKLSTLAKGKKLYVPGKKHKRFNYWNQKGRLVQGCELHEDKMIVWFDVEKQQPKEGISIGIDLGMRKMISTSGGQFFGKEIHDHITKILRKKKNSKAYRRALRERDNIVNRAVNSIDWGSLSSIAYEDLTKISQGRKGFRAKKSFRIRQQHWAHRKVVARVLEKAEENRVRPLAVDPRNTSRTCPVCGNVDKLNRKNEEFRCLACGHEQDADSAAATNILVKSLRVGREPRVPDA